MKFLLVITTCMLSISACKTPYEVDASLSSQRGVAKSFITMKCSAANGSSYYFVSPVGSDDVAVALYDNSGERYARQFLQGKFDERGGTLNDVGSPTINIYSMSRNGAGQVALTVFKNGQLTNSAVCTSGRVNDYYAALSCKTYDSSYRFVSWPIVETFEVLSDSDEEPSRVFLDGVLESGGTGELKTSQRGQPTRFSITRGISNQFTLQMFVNASLRETGSCQLD